MCWCGGCVRRRPVWFPASLYNWLPISNKYLEIRMFTAGEAFFSLSSVDWKIEPSTLSKTNTLLQMGEGLCVKLANTLNLCDSSSAATHPHRMRPMPATCQLFQLLCVHPSLYICPCLRLITLRPLHPLAFLPSSACIMAGVTHAAWDVPGRALLYVTQAATGMSTVMSGVGYWRSAGFGKRAGDK